MEPTKTVLAWLLGIVIAVLVGAWLAGCHTVNGMADDVKLAVRPYVQNAKGK